jgi:hypothetical protein
VPADLCLLLREKNLLPPVRLTDSLFVKCIAILNNMLLQIELISQDIFSQLYLIMIYCLEHIYKLLSVIDLHMQIL